MTKYAKLSEICELTGATTEANVNEVVALLSDPEFAQGRIPIQRGEDMYIEFETVHEAAHKGPSGFPADQLYDVYEDIEFVPLPAHEKETTRPARTPKVVEPKEDSNHVPAGVENQVKAALKGIPEVEDDDGIEEEEPKPISKPKAAKKAEPAPEKKTLKKVEAEDEPKEDSFVSAVDMAINMAKSKSSLMERDDLITALQDRKEKLVAELSVVINCLESL